MKYIEIIKEQIEDEERRLALVGEGFFGGLSSKLQLQIEQNGNDAYIDLSIEETQALLLKLHEWLSEKKADHGVGINYKIIESLISLHISADIMLQKLPENMQLELFSNSIAIGKNATKVLREYFNFGDDACYKVPKV
jgi:hypothetical protein